MTSLRVLAAGLVALAVLLAVWFLRPAPAPATVAPSLATGSAPAAPVAGDVLHVAVEDAAGPWSLLDGSGYANDVVRAAFTASGVSAVLDVVPYARCKEMVVSGEIAACFSMSRSPELDAAVVFADLPLFTCQTAFVQKTAKRIGARSAAEIPHGTLIGTVLGYEYPLELRQLIASGQVVNDVLSSEAVSLRKLAAGRIDYAIVNWNRLKPVSVMLDEAGVGDQVEAAFSSGSLESYIGFSRRHARGLTSRDQFNTGFQRIRADGSLARIEQQWADRLSAGRAAGGARR